MTRDRLDDAIDVVAARLTCVREDDGFAPRITAGLPDRSPWLLYSWIPRIAITAVLVAGVSLVVLRPFDGRTAGVLRPESAGGPFVEFRAAIERTSVEPKLIVRRTTGERSQSVRRTIEDFDRSLAAIAPLAALSLKAVAPSDLPGQGALVVAPLAIPDLPLTAETMSPR